ncbi:hypothetical protein KM1_077620 [Entamoeba histolytica HM-3:IMSS]|uniref:Uncharacterized protein n=1 Tax=Entamoeba histolytica HM-3:IMSS TaxID=885315 RepID=M7WVP6_ENTHI|nr:hypothetical protein KM1_077620 [Entamoeba histolytica HM-3:IMSS]
MQNNNFKEQYEIMMTNYKIFIDYIPLYQKEVNEMNNKADILEQQCNDLRIEIQQYEEKIQQINN